MSTTPRTKKKPAASETETALIVAPIEDARPALVLEGDPEAQLAFAQKAAKALMSVVEQKPKKVIINNKQYLEYGDWQTLARFFGATVGTESKAIERNGIVVGYEAIATVRQHGLVIATADGICMREEKRWAKADEYAIRSMAQTRTAAKALRNAFGWVAELAGYQSTPAEEMPYEPAPAAAAPVVSVFARAKQMIERATDPEVLNDYWKKVSTSDKYTAEEKEKVEGLIAARIQELEKLGAEGTIPA